MAQPHFDEDDIERLLADLEAAAEGRKPPPKSASPQRTPQHQQQQMDTTPKRLADFSTYASVPSASDQAGNEDSPPARRALPAKLQPLTATHAAASPLPPISAAGHAIAPLAGGVRPSALEAKAVLAAIAPTATSAAPSTSNASSSGAPSPASSGAPHEDPTTAAADAMLVSLLPVMLTREVPFGGIVPRARWGHTLTTIGDSLILFGGAVLDERSAHATATADLFEASTLSTTWEPVFCAKGEIPTPRVQHTATAYLGRSLVVFGGSPLSRPELLNDVHLFDAVTQEWAVLAGLAEGKGDVPTGRLGHSAVIAASHLVIFGGRCNRKAKDARASSYVLSSDVFVFDIEARKWLKRLKSGDATAAGVGDGEGDGTAEAKDSVGIAGPAKRYNHAACVANGTMFVHGGQNNDEVLADTWALDLATQTWTQVHTGVGSVPRASHLLFCAGGILAAFGGADVSAPGGRNALMAALPLSADEAGRVGGARWVATKSSGFAVDAGLRRFGAALHHGFVYLLGGTTGPETPSPTMLRFLALDGIETDEGHEHGAPAIMRRLRRSAILEDIFMEVGGQRIGAHRFVLALRAPSLLEEIAACRNVADTSQTAVGGAGTGNSKSAGPAAPIYSLEGNSRVRGLSKPMTAAQLKLLLEYLYTGQLPVDESDPAAAEALVLLGDVAAAYNIDHLVDVLQPFDAQPQQGRSRTRHHQQGATRFADRLALSRRRGEQRLAADLMALLDSGKDASAQVLFQDPHTGATTSAAVHPAVLIHSSDVFRHLLKPLVCDGVASVEFQGIHARSGAAGRATTSRRGVVVGTVPIPTLSVRFVLRHLYTGALDVPPESALAVMIAAHVMRLPRLQGYCECLVAREEVTETTCCDFLTLAKQYRAHHLHELSLLTAATAFGETSMSQQFRSLSAADQDEIHRAAVLLAGRAVGQAVATPAGAALQKPPSHYKESFART